MLKFDLTLHPPGHAVLHNYRLDPDPFEGMFGDTIAGFEVAVEHDGEKVLYSVPGAGGEVECYYDPRTALLCVLDLFGRLLYPDEAAVEARAREKDITAELARRKLTAEFAERVGRHFNRAAALLLEQVPAKLLEAFYELPYEVAARAFRELGEGDGRRGGEHLAREALRFAESFKSARLKSPARGGPRNVKFDWDDDSRALLVRHLEESKPVLKDAKAIYKQNRHRDKWREMVRAAHPELDEDLIEMLAGPDPYDSSPASVAHERAARLCGCPPNTYSVRQLKRQVQIAKGGGRLGQLSEDFEFPKDPSPSVSIKMSVGDALYPSPAKP